ncbi:hypothetical protein LB543_01470 [Mesorhizobium sp. ESP7-2]|uniref:hypothetical protein n=1 Tax=Mesorhizobium sp. ESP7-2 TaxID=2876622 RepID=UPI001CCAB3F0|nr:hypothetical protein [Mesorhizobium sp. ESP7-2]MBZ9705398.1 hypothetical protein [Mesorhizobium sp. ESP7-2]
MLGFSLLVRLGMAGGAASVSAPANTVPPVISGNAYVGSTLTASAGTWAHGVDSYAYQWQADGADVGSNQNTYAPVSGDVGKVVTCTVTATNAGGPASAASAATAAVIATPGNTVSPAISGNAYVGSTLTASAGTWSGGGSPTYAYQWKSNGSNVGVNQNTYVPVSGDLGHTITCTVTATNAAGSGTPVASAATAAVIATPSNTVLPAISGTATQGQTLSCSAGTWSGGGSISYAYQWKADGTNISAATASTYLLTASEVGKVITCAVTATNAAGSASATSAATATVTPVVANPSYWNAGGRGDRTSSITVTTTATLGAGTINNLIDGGFGGNSTDACWFDAGQSSRQIKFDFGAGVQKVIDAFRWVQDTSGTHGTWVFEGSNDDSSYTTIGSSFTLGSASVAYLFFSATNSTAYRYYKLRQTSGTTSSGPWLQELEFRIADPAIGEVRDALVSGDRTSLITTTTTATMSLSARIDNLIDGDFSANAAGSAAFSSESLREIKFDLASGKILTGFLWLQDAPNTHGTWVFEGSNDDSAYTGLGSSFTLGGAIIQQQTWSNSTAYRYYKLRQTSGTTSSSPWLLEIEFRVA